jgi:hypothetical protein
MTAATALVLEAPAAALPLDDEIDAVVETAILSFLNGENDGKELFQALYGDTLDEPVPEHLLALVRGHRG